MDDASGFSGNSSPIYIGISRHRAVEIYRGLPGIPIIHNFDRIRGVRLPPGSICTCLEIITQTPRGKHEIYYINSADRTGLDVHPGREHCPCGDANADRYPYSICDADAKRDSNSGEEGSQHSIDGERPVVGHRQQWRLSQAGMHNRRHSLDVS